jgi:drug/metabolite transporter, DME family
LAYSTSPQPTAKAPARTGGLLVVLAAVLWGTTGTSQALAPTDASPLAVGTLRIIVGGVALLALAVGRGGFRDRVRWAPALTALAIVATASYQLTFFGGVAATGVAVGTVIALGSAPAFAGLLGAAFAGERLTARWTGATIVAVLGCVLLVLWGNTSGVTVDLCGVLLSLGAGLSYATFTLANKRLLDTHAPDEAMAVSFCGGALVLAPLLFMVDTDWVWSGGGLVVVLHLGLLATGLSYALFGRGLRAVGVSAASTLSLAEPLTAALLGLLLLGEPLTVGGAVGMGLIFAGLALLTVRRGK